MINSELKVVMEKERDACFASQGVAAVQAISAALFLWSIPGNRVDPDLILRFLDLLVHGPNSPHTLQICKSIFAPGLLLK